MTTSFQKRLINRSTFPNKNILICEDDLDAQIRLITSMRRLLEPQGLVTVSLVAGTHAASAIMEKTKVDLLILDYDMPIGNAEDLYCWMSRNHIRNVPVITASGIDANNDHMITLAVELGITTHKFSKNEVIDGAADHIIKRILEL